MVVGFNYKPNWPEIQRKQQKQQFKQQLQQHDAEMECGSDTAGPEAKSLWDCYYSKTQNNNLVCKFTLLCCNSDKYKLVY